MWARAESVCGSWPRPRPRGCWSSAGARWPRKRALTAMAAGGLLGTLPLLWYEAASWLATLRYMMSARQPLTWALVGQRLQRLADCMISDREQRVIWGGPPIGSWELALGAALLGLTLVARVRARADPDRVARASWRRAFAADRALLDGRSSRRRDSTSAQHHIVAVVPLAFAALAILAVEAAGRLRAFAPVLAAGAAGLGGRVRRLGRSHRPRAARDRRHSRVLERDRRRRGAPGGPPGRAGAAEDPQLGNPEQPLRRARAGPRTEPSSSGEPRASERSAADSGTMRSATEERFCCSPFRWDRRGSGTEPSDSRRPSSDMAAPGVRRCFGSGRALPMRGSWRSLRLQLLLDDGALLPGVAGDEDPHQLRLRPGAESIRSWTIGPRSLSGEPDRERRGRARAPARPRRPSRPAGRPRTRPARGPVVDRRQLLVGHPLAPLELLVDRDRVVVGVRRDVDLQVQRPVARAAPCARSARRPSRTRARGLRRGCPSRRRCRRTARRRRAAPARGSR